MDSRNAIRAALSEWALPEPPVMKQERGESRSIPAEINNRLNDTTPHLADQSR